MAQLKSTLTPFIYEILKDDEKNKTQVILFLTKYRPNQFLETTMPYNMGTSKMFKLIHSDSYADKWGDIQLHEIQGNQEIFFMYNSGTTAKYPAKITKMFSPKGTYSPEALFDAGILTRDVFIYLSVDHFKQRLNMKQKDAFSSKNFNPETVAYLESVINTNFNGNLEKATQAFGQNFNQLMLLGDIDLDEIEIDEDDQDYDKDTKYTTKVDSETESEINDLKIKTALGKLTVKECNILLFGKYDPQFSSIEKMINFWDEKMPKDQCTKEVLHNFMYLAYVNKECKGKLNLD